MASSDGLVDALRELRSRERLHERAKETLNLLAGTRQLMTTFTPRAKHQELQTRTLAESLKQIKQDWVIGRWKDISLKDYIELQLKYLSSQHNILFSNGLKWEIDKWLQDEVIQTLEDIDQQKTLLAPSDGEQQKSQDN